MKKSKLQTHNSKPLQSKKPLWNKTTIKKKSFEAVVDKIKRSIDAETHAPENRKKIYWELRDEYLQNHPVCEICQKRGSNQIHHVNRQKNSFIFRFFLAVCPQCHLWIHDHSVKSKELELITEYKDDGNYDLDKIEKEWRIRINENLSNIDKTIFDI